MAEGIYSFSFFRIPGECGSQGRGTEAIAAIVRGDLHEGLEELVSDVCRGAGDSQHDSHEPGEGEEMRLVKDGQSE